MSTALDLHLSGAEAAARRYDEIARNLANIAPAAPAIFALMERREKALFAELGGRYVRTGATLRSLTQRGDRAIREAHADTLEFGSAVEYAVYLTAPPVLRVGTREVASVADAIMDHVVRP